MSSIPPLTPLPEHLLVLGPGLWVDLEAGIILRSQVQILLSARQVRLLTQLEHARRTTRGFLSAQALIPALGLTQAVYPERCVEQLISELRKKLGEVPRHPTILRGRRGFGYRLCPDLLSDPPEPLPLELLSSSAVHTFVSGDLPDPVTSGQ